METKRRADFGPKPKSKRAIMSALDRAMAKPAPKRCTCSADSAMCDFCARAIERQRAWEMKHG